MSSLSLKWRLSLLIGVMVALVAAIVPMALYREMRKSLFYQLDDKLLIMGSVISTLLQEENEDPGEQNMDIQSIVGSPKQPRVTLFRVWRDSSMEVLYARDSKEKDFWKNALSLQAPPETKVIFDAGRPGNEYRVLWLRAKTRQGVINFAVAEPSHHVIKELSKSLDLLIVVGSGCVVGSMFLVLLLVSWGVRPIRRTAEAMLEVTAGNVGNVRLDDRNVPSEVVPFVHTTSAMLGRLDKAMQQQKQFVADASHELRTPLTLAMSTLQAARMRDRGTEVYKQALDEIMQDLQRMQYLLSELLVLAQMEETRGIFDPGAVNLESLLQNVAEPFTARIAQTGGQLVCSLRSAVIWGNHGQLARLFTNLLDNAVTHGPSGGEVQLRVEEGSAGDVIVCVQDEGGNIPPEALPYLFDRFYRVDPSRSSATGGAGLGLSIAREIVVRHGGDITVVSNSEVGTQVCVRLPLMKKSLVTHKSAVASTREPD